MQLGQLLEQPQLPSRADLYQVLADTNTSQKLLQELNPISPAKEVYQTVFHVDYALKVSFQPFTLSCESIGSFKPSREDAIFPLLFGEHRFSFQLTNQFRTALDSNIKELGQRWPQLTTLHEHCTKSMIESAKVEEYFSNPQSVLSKDEFTETTATLESLHEFISRLVPQLQPGPASDLFSPSDQKNGYHFLFVSSYIYFLSGINNILAEKSQEIQGVIDKVKQYGYTQ